MKTWVAATLLGLCGLAPVWAQQTVDQATREDVEQMLQVTGSRKSVQQLWVVMAQQVAGMAADEFKRKHPEATPLQQRKAAEAAAEMMQSTMKLFPINEMFDAMIPIYQRHLSHTDVQAILEFYDSPSGQKMLREMPQMMAESIQASTAIIQKHMPELEAQAEKAANESVQRPDAQ